jgi:hypothetical protein
VIVADEARVVDVSAVLQSALQIAKRRGDLRDRCRVFSHVMWFQYASKLALYMIWQSNINIANRRIILIGTFALVILYSVCILVQIHAMRMIVLLNYIGLNHSDCRVI